MDTELNINGEIVTIPEGWETVFIAAKKSLDFAFSKLKEEELTYGEYYPRPVELFTAFRLVPLDKVKVVIVGQDPYPQSIYLDGQSRSRAMGLAFSTRKGDEVPVSLKNIYRELKQSIPEFVIPDHGDLTNWAKQGVLLLNISLTVRPNQPNKHRGLWRGFIHFVLRALEKTNPECVYVMWGAEAQELASDLTSGTQVIGCHPAARGKTSFVGCGHFVTINEHLISAGKEPIDWKL